MNTELYHDLCREIEILKIRIRDLEAEYKMWYKKGCHGHMAPLDISLKRMEEICDQVEMYSMILGEKEKARQEIENQMNQFEGLEYKIAYMRDVRGMSLVDIAVDLGYSYIWVKQLSSRTSRKKKKKEHTKSILTG